MAVALPARRRCTQHQTPQGLNLLLGMSALKSFPNEMTLGISKVCQAYSLISCQSCHVQCKLNCMTLHGTAPAHPAPYAPCTALPGLPRVLPRHVREPGAGTATGPMRAAAPPASAPRDRTTGRGLRASELGCGASIPKPNKMSLQIVKIVKRCYDI